MLDRVVGGVDGFIMVDSLWGHWDFSLNSISQDFYDMLSLLFELTAVLFFDDWKCKGYTA